MTPIRSPLQAQIVQWLVVPGDAVQAGDLLVILEAMKMEHEVRAGHSGCVGELFFAQGDVVAEGGVLLNLTVQGIETCRLEGDLTKNKPLAPVLPSSTLVSGDGPRPDLQKMLDRQAFTLDANRPEAVAKRHTLGLRTARENIADLCDADSFMEYGALAVAAQRSRRSEADLIQNTPADGMVTGIGSINASLFGPGHSRAVVMAYDATVLAGTQGMRNHQKTDRMLGIALQQKLPVVLFAEGGGGRPGDVDMPIVAGLHVATFASYARLNGQVRIPAIVTSDSGRS